MAWGNPVFSSTARLASFNQCRRCMGSCTEERTHCYSGAAVRWEPCTQLRGQMVWQYSKLLGLKPANAVSHGPSVWGQALVLPFSPPALQCSKGKQSPQHCDVFYLIPSHGGEDFWCSSEKIITVSSRLVGGRLLAKQEENCLETTEKH